MPKLSISLERVSPVPLYHQLARQLEGAIRQGRLTKGDFLDNELDLARLWHISRPTVRRAIQELVQMGLLMRRRGVGTQVVNDRIRRPSQLSSLFEDLVAQGRRPSTTVLGMERVPADEDVADSLGLPVGTEVVHIKRCRSADATKLAFLRNWIVVEAAADLTPEQLTGGGLYAFMRARGFRPNVATQRISARLATVEDASVLDLDVGAPLVTMWQLVQDDMGRLVELGDHAYNAAHYSVEITVVES